MKRKNPLLIYRNWFTELNLSLSDCIARAMFEALSQKQLQYNLGFNLNLSQNLGVLSIHMLNLLNRQIDFKQKISDQQFALTLLDVTLNILQGDEPLEPALLEKYKEHYFQNLINGNQPEADYYEDLLQRLSLELDYKDSWNKLDSSGFNFHAIHDYMFRDNFN